MSALKKASTTPYLGTPPLFAFGGTCTNKQRLQMQAFRRGGASEAGGTSNICPLSGPFSGCGTQKFLGLPRTSVIVCNGTRHTTCRHKSTAQIG
jgi:hypothetical protein